MEYLPLIEGEDYVIDRNGRFVFTKEYLIRRGYCCRNGCLNCPYGNVLEESGSG